MKSVNDEVIEVIEEFKKKNPHVWVVTKEEVFGIVICFDHKLARTRTNIMFTETELRSLRPNLKKTITKALDDTVKILIKGQKTN